MSELNPTIVECPHCIQKDAKIEKLKTQISEYKELEEENIQYNNNSDMRSLITEKMMKYFIQEMPNDEDFIEKLIRKSVGLKSVLKKYKLETMKWVNGTESEVVVERTEETDDESSIISGLSSALNKIMNNEQCMKDINTFMSDESVMGKELVDKFKFLMADIANK